MKELKLIINIACFICLFAACETIFDPDIEEQSIETVAPENESEISENLIRFTWTGLEDAEDYHFQLFNYTGGTTTEMDTTVSDTSVLLIAESYGDYVWRVRAENEVSETAYVYSSFFVPNDSLLNINLSNEIPVLLSPQDSLEVIADSLDFIWVTIEEASSYQIEIAKPDFSNSSNILYTNLLSENNYTWGEFTSGFHQWRVKAINESSESTYATRTFFIIE